MKRTKSKSRKEQGIALTVMLVVLMFAATLSFGMLFLTQNNLKVAENIRNHAVAKYNAEAGIEVSNIMLNEDWRETGKMPTANNIESMAPLAISATEKPFEYYLDPEVFNSTSNNIYLAIVGQSGPDASYMTEMLAEAVASNTAHKLPLAVYGEGIVSKKVVSMNGMDKSKFMSTGIHGNKGYTLNGKAEARNMMVCNDRDDRGVCDDWERSEYPWDHFTVSVDETGHTCNADPRAKLCPDSKPRNMASDPFNPWNADGTLKAPQPPVINPEASLLLGLFQKGFVDAQDLVDLGYLNSTEEVSLRNLADTNGDGAANHDGNYGAQDQELDLTAVKNHLCSQTNVKHYNGRSIKSQRDLARANFEKDKVTCVTNKWVTFDDAVNLEGMTIIVKSGGINFNDAGYLENTTLITTSNINMDKGKIDSSLIYTAGSFHLNNDADIEGITSLLSAGDIIHNGSTDVAANDEGSSVIGLNMVTKGNIYFNNSSKTYGIYQSRGTFTANNDSEMFGSILAEDDIFFNGGIEFDSSLPFENPTLEAVELVAEEAGFIITGRR